MSFFSWSSLSFYLLSVFIFSCKKHDVFRSPLPITQTKTVNIQVPEEAGNTINVFNFNILAPCWADPIYYPVSSVPYLDRVTRRQAIIDLLKSNQEKADIIALQEVAQVEFGHLAEALGSAYVGFQANHSVTYWSNWVTPKTPWELNGNAVFIRKERFENIFFEDFPASVSGNHAALFTGLLKNSGNRSVRLASIHLDSDHAYNRKRELQAVLSKWVPQSNTTDIIAGDFNTETDATNIQSAIRKAGYFDLLGVLGKKAQTHPWDSKYYASGNWGIIDHIIFRNSAPLDGAVIDFNLFELYPENEEMRINKNLQLSGSDHFPVWGSLGH